MSVEPEVPTLARLRRLVLTLVLIGLAGTATELYLMGHTEDTEQLIPFVVMSLAAATILWRLRAATPGSVLAVRLAMALLVGAGALGSFYHYRANMEFQIEMDPSLAGLDLFMKVVEAKSPPSLAPGNMALLGLLGLAGVYRDPGATAYVAAPHNAPGRG